VCPVCNAKIMAKRAMEWGAMVAAWLGQGHRVALMTFTMRHRAGQGLGMLWDSLSDAWGSVTAGNGWLGNKRDYRVAHVLRVVEVTHGRNGWHVHVHALVFVEGEPNQSLMESLHGAMFGRWRASLLRSGLRAPLMRGQDVRIVGTEWIADYLAKSTDRARAVGREVAWSQGKKARTAFGTVTQWDILDGVQQGDADALDWWREWERGSAGRRQVSYSRGMREYFRLLREESDEEIAAEELGSSADDVVVITEGGWRQLLACDATTLGPLRAMEQGGWPAVRAYLEERGIEYRVCDDIEAVA
jgi:hypothetical protein